MIGLSMVAVSPAQVVVTIEETIRQPPKTPEASGKPAAQSPNQPIAGSSADDPIDLATSSDPIRDLQRDAVRRQHSDTVHWGRGRQRYVSWSNHSNRLIPVYTFGITLDSWRDRGSVYADPQRIAKLYGHVPDRTYNPVARYYDQTDIHRLQQLAVDRGCSVIITMILDGMDWQTTRAAAICADPRRSRQAAAEVYRSGRGSGLSWMDYRGCQTDFGLVVTSPFARFADFDIDAQIVQPSTDPIGGQRDARGGGYDVVRGGAMPWLENADQDYLMGLDREVPHAFTDSAASATSIFSGIKTYNGAINVDPDGKHVVPISRQLQADGWKIGVVTSVPVSHATPAAAYANNVARQDYQDIARDLIGLPSSSHRDDPLPGVDVLLGGGWGESANQSPSQGRNYLPGNPYIHESDVRRVAVAVGEPIDESADGPDGRLPYVLAHRTPGTDGRDVLSAAAAAAVDEDRRLLGLFGVHNRHGSHLPFRTADGNYDPTFDITGVERYSPADISENVTLAEMTSAALTVLEQSIEGFYLMVEAGDVDWANHSNNIDNSIGAVLSGNEAFNVITDWVRTNRAWDYTAVIVTADHGHYLVVDDDDAIMAAADRAAMLRSASGNP